MSGDEPTDFRRRRVEEYMCSSYYEGESYRVEKSFLPIIRFCKSTTGKVKITTGSGEIIRGLIPDSLFKLMKVVSNTLSLLLTTFPIPHLYLPSLIDLNVISCICVHNQGQRQLYRRIIY